MAIKQEKIIRSAEKLVSKGKIEPAIKEYRKILAENPNDANTLNRVGDLYARIERFDEAVKLFSQIAEQYTRDGFFVKAIAIYKKIIKLSPSSLQVYERLAELYYKQGLLNEARTQYQILASHYEKRENTASAITIYQRMAEIDPENPTHHLKLAQSYQKEELHEKAIKSYRQLADLLLVAGSVDEATQVYLKTIDAYHQNLELVETVARGLYNDGHEEAAESVLERARGLNPEAASISLGAPPELEPGSPPAATTAPENEPPTAKLMAEMEASPALSLEDDDSVFTLDLDDDEPAATQVRPPDEVEEEVADGSFSDQPGAESVAEEDSDEIEIDWTSDDMPGFDLDEDDEDEIPIEIEIEDEEEFEIDLEVPEDDTIQGDATLGFQEAAAKDAPAPAGDHAEPDDAEAADSGSATPVRLAEDLLDEARAFARYDLRQKAEGHLTELLKIQPDHLGGLCLMAELDLKAERRDEAIERAQKAGAIAARSKDTAPWDKLRGIFSAAGIELEEARVEAAPLEPADGSAESPTPEVEALDETDVSPAVEDDLFTDDDLFEEPSPTIFDEEPVAVDDTPVEVEPPAQVSEIEALMERAQGEEDPDDFLTDEPETGGEEPAPAEAASQDGLVSLADELDLGDISQEEQTATTQDTGDDTGMSWLDDVTGEVATAEAESESLFDEEDDFFDLAAELEAEMGDDDEPEISLEQPKEQDLQGIIDGFKQGVSESLSAEDFDTHFNLGIAYREMGLLDEAIGAFQTASKDPRRIGECSSMLGICFLEKGLPELAVKWYKKGLESPALEEKESLGLLYDLANAYLHLADYDTAYDTFVELYGIKSDYQDVAERVKELAEYKAATAAEGSAEGSADGSAEEPAG